MKKIYVLLLLIAISITTSKSQDMNATADELGSFLTPISLMNILGRMI
ncbi:MAG: hypothetical protein V4547_12425 [Bacteroidota bacterium]